MPDVNISLFSQCLQIFDRADFDRLVKKHKANKFSKGISSWCHLVSMVFCHLAKSSSIREISDGLRSAAGNLNHLGMDRSPCKSSISYINAHRNWELFRDFYFALLERTEPSLARRRQYAARLKRKIFLMDATTISLCLSLFDWAKYRTRKGAIKLHTILDYDTALPVFLHMTEGRKHETKVTPVTVFPAGSVVVMDRAYVKYDYLFNLDSNDIYFVTRLKRNADIELVESFLTPAKKEHILSDEDVRLSGFYTSQKYPKTLRVVEVYDEASGQHLFLLTNNLFWTADTISQLYKARWDIEVFFKQIKQVLKIKTFIGTTPNAVLIQVWTAMISILLLKYLQKRAKHKWHLSNLAAMLRTHLFSKINVREWLDYPFIKSNPPPNNLPLLDLL
ncbi:MAG: IS4 family transposase [Chitinophagaceae bacterium]